MPEPSAKALNHYHSGMVLLGVSILWNMLIPALFLFTGLSARIRTWAEHVGRRWYFSFGLYCLAFGLLYYLTRQGLRPARQGEFGDIRLILELPCWSGALPR